MATASHSLATALWRARFASGLLRPSYTTSLDTTNDVYEPYNFVRARASFEAASRRLSNAV
jgi:hypothetical protein